MQDDRDDTALAASGAIDGCAVALVGQRRALCDVWPDVKRDFKAAAVTDLATDRMNGNGWPVEIRLGVGPDERPHRESCLLLGA
jgi:hypothetical protein